MKNKGQVELPVLRVAKPCTEDWEQMVGDDRVRYCRKCELNVYNFAGMTRDEVAGLVTSSDGRICGRLHRRQDGTVVTKDCNPEPRPNFGEVTRWAAIALSAAMSVTVATAQTKSTPAANVAEQAKKSETTSVQVSDQTEAVIPNATITLTGEDTKQHYEGTTDETGLWSNSKIVPGNYTLRVERQGFAPVKMSVKFPGRIVVRMGPDFENLEMGVIVNADGIGLQTEPVQLPDIINPVALPKNKP